MVRWLVLCPALILTAALCCGSGTLWGAEPPASLHWQTQAQPKSLGSPKAQRGGKLVSYIPSFPLTLRQVGPDAASSFRRLLDDNDMSLLTMHPNDESWIPMLASHWALAADGKTVFYRLNSGARWSDGQPVKASDYLFTLEFMRSPFIQSPWSNEYYTSTIAKVESFQEKTGTEVIAITLTQPSTDRLLMTNLKPMPRHFYGTLGPDFVSKFNWLVPPNIGPYTLATVEKSRRVVFQRKKDWWAKDLPFFANRFNIDEIVLKVVPDIQIAFEYLKIGEIDAMAITNPDLWKPSPGEDAFTKGYIHKLQAYNDTPRNDYALILNQAYGPFQDKRVRIAFAHAMNVDRVIDELLRDGFQRLQGISQGYGAFTNPNIKARKFDLKEADALFKQAGWSERNAEGIRSKDGKPLTAQVSYGQSNMTPRLLILQDDARKAGIDLQLQLMDYGMAFKSFRDKLHQVAFMVWGTPYRPEYRSRFHSSEAGKPQTSNFSNTASPVLDQLIEEYEHASDDRKRIEKAHAIQQFVYEDACYIPLFEVPYYRLAYWSWIQFPEISGAKTSDDLSYFDSAIGGLFWIDAERRSAVLGARKRGERLPPRIWIDESFRLKKTAL